MSRFYFSFIVLTVLFATIFTSCGKDDTSIQLLETISYNGKLRQKFEYDKQHRITKIIHYSYHTEDDKIVCTQIFDYDRDGDLISLYFDLTENPHRSQLISITKPVENTITLQNEMNIKIIEINHQGLPDKYEGYYQYFDGNGYVMHSTPMTIEYSDERFEITMAIATAGTIIPPCVPPVAISTFAYGNKKPPLYYCKTQKWALFPEYSHLQYNILTSTNTRMEGCAFEETTTYTSNYTYTYDNAGFPMTMTIASDNGYERGIETYTYQKK